VDREETTVTFTRGDTVYWAKEPKGRFTFVGVNRDGSYHIVGGEDGYRSGRDALPEQVAVVPFEGTDQLLYYAKQEANFAVEVTVGFLAEKFNLPTSTVGKFVRENPHLFRKIGHGKYEVRGHADEARATAERQAMRTQRKIKKVRA
jgi:hypothetical protein